MLKDQLGIDVDPDMITQNIAPQFRMADCCRWCVDGTRDGKFIHVCSWDTMGDIVRHKVISVVDPSPLTFEVCLSERHAWPVGYTGRGPLPAPSADVR